MEGCSTSAEWAQLINSYMELSECADLIQAQGTGYRDREGILQQLADSLRISPNPDLERQLTFGLCYHLARLTLRSIIELAIPSSCFASIQTALEDRAYQVVELVKNGKWQPDGAPISAYAYGVRGGDNTAIWPARLRALCSEMWGTKPHSRRHQVHMDTVEEKHDAVSGSSDPSRKGDLEHDFANYVGRLPVKERLLALKFIETARELCAPGTTDNKMGSIAIKATAREMHCSEKTVERLREKVRADLVRMGYTDLLPSRHENKGDI